jgi:hypothetical protein
MTATAIPRPFGRDAKLRPSRLERLFAAHLRTSPPAAMLYCLASAAVAFGDADRTSLLIGGVTSLSGEALRIVTAGYGYKIGELAVRGPYRFVRHPYFLGTALVHLGVCLASRNPYVMALGMVLIVLAYRRRFRLDEERWRQRLGPAFVDYVARVQAFLPQLLPAPPHGEKHKFSIGLAVLTGRHRELDAVLMLALVYLGLYLPTLSVVRGSWAGDLFRPAVVITTLGYAILRLAHYGALPYVRTALHTRSRLSRHRKPPVG